MLAFKIFDIQDNGIEYNSTVELDPRSSDSIDEINYLNELKKDKKVYVYPLEPDGITFLMKPKPRGRSRVPDDIIVFIHEQNIEHGIQPGRLTYKIFQKFGVELKTGFIQSILAQEKYEDVAGIDHLRKQAKDRIPKKTGRKRKITDEMKKEWIRLHEEENMSGNAISKKFNVSSPSVNAVLRERFGRRKNLKKVLAVEVVR